MEANLYIALVAVRSYPTRGDRVIASVTAQAPLRVRLKFPHLLGDYYTHPESSVQLQGQEVVVEGDAVQDASFIVRSCRPWLSHHMQILSPKL